MELAVSIRALVVHPFHANFLTSSSRHPRWNKQQGAIDPDAPFLSPIQQVGFEIEAPIAISIPRHLISSYGEVLLTNVDI